MFRVLGIVLAALHSSLVCGWGAIGDEWITTRGDESPGQRYALAAVTTSGRIIGMTWGGGLMFSDDGGSSWTFDRIEIGGVPARGTFSALYQVPGGELIAVMRTLEESSVGYFKYYIRTHLLTSRNNGSTWTQEPFPLTYATLQGTTRRYYGVDITGLHMGPGGQLLAYGSTSGTNHPGFVLWSLGGAIFRRTGNDWVQAHFGYGPVGKVTDAGGRAVAASYNAVLDSADGAGWNGYPMGNAQVDLSGNAMDIETKFRLRLLDIEVLNGTYIAQGATFVPFRDSSFIDTHIFVDTYKMSSTTPFSASRNWNAFKEPYHGFFNKIGNNIFTSGHGPAYLTSSGGPGFTLANAEMNVQYKAIAVANSTTAYGIATSDLVWKTTNGGASWTKVRDTDMGPDLNLIGAENGILFARAGYQLWRSLDLGWSWHLAANNFTGRQITDGGGGRILTSAGGATILVSEDRGSTWESWTIPSTSQVRASMILKSKTGRLIVPAEGRSIRNEGVFYVSDDDGATWSPRIAGLQWIEQPTAFVQTQSGRIIVSANSNSVFNPKLYISDDDGDTWVANRSLQRLDGLNPISNEPHLRVIRIEKMLSSSTGRIVALGDDEILTSDDDGQTWTVRVNLDLNQIGPWLGWDIRDITQAGNRWIAVGHYRTPYPQNRYMNFLLISDDDGATWGQRPFQVSQANTLLLTVLTEPESGRVIVAGNNGAVFISDPDKLTPPAGSGDDAERLFVREGRTETVPVQRPDADGRVEAVFALRSNTAIADVDFKPGSGLLVWEADDFSEKLVSIETIDNSIVDGERELFLQIAFTTSDDFVGTMEIPVSILDNDKPGQAGLFFENTKDLYTSEAGGSVDIAFALESKPSADIIVTVESLDTTEGIVSQSTYTFTSANWNQLQIVTVTGVDDNFPDGDATYELAFSITTTDPQYSIVPTTRLAIVNRGDEPYVVGGENFARFLKGIPVEPSMQNGQFAFSFKVPDTGYTYLIGSEVSSNFIEWIPGPDPVKGPTEKGLITYTLLLTPSSDPVFARFTFDMVP